MDQVERFRKMVDDIINNIFANPWPWYNANHTCISRVYRASIVAIAAATTTPRLLMIMTMTTTTVTLTVTTELTELYVFDCVEIGNCLLAVGEKFNVALANSGVGSATVSARGRTNGAAAWPSRRNDCRPSSICTVCTISRDAPYRRLCGIFSSRPEFVGVMMASFLSTPSGGPYSVDTPGMAWVTTLYAWSVYPVYENGGYVELLYFEVMRLLLLFFFLIQSRIYKWILASSKVIQKLKHIRYVMYAYQSTYRWLRSGECGSFSDAHHHVFGIIGRGFQTKLFLIFWILVRRSGHVPMWHGWWGTHMIHRYFLIIKLFLVIGNVFILLVIVIVRLFRSEKCVWSLLNVSIWMDVKYVGDLFDRERTLFYVHDVRHS